MVISKSFAIVIEIRIRYEFRELHREHVFNFVVCTKEKRTFLSIV